MIPKDYRLLTLNEFHRFLFLYKKKRQTNSFHLKTFAFLEFRWRSVREFSIRKILLKNVTILNSSCALENEKKTQVNSFFLCYFWCIVLHGSINKNQNVCHAHTSISSKPYVFLFSPAIFLLTQFILLIQLLALPFLCFTSRTNRIKECRVLNTKNQIHQITVSETQNILPIE